MRLRGAMHRTETQRVRPTVWKHEGEHRLTVLETLALTSSSIPSSPTLKQLKNSEKLRRERRAVGEDLRKREDDIRWD